MERAGSSTVTATRHLPQTFQVKTDWLVNINIHFQWVLDVYMYIHRMYLLLLSYFPALLVLTALGGYTLAPAPIHVGTLLWTVAGTGLCSAAANSFNQVRKLYIYIYIYDDHFLAYRFYILKIIVLFHKLHC